MRSLPHRQFDAGLKVRQMANIVAWCRKPHRLQFTLRSLLIAIEAAAVASFVGVWSLRASRVAVIAEDYQYKSAMYEVGAYSDVHYLCELSKHWMAIACSLPFASGDDARAAHLMRMRQLESRSKGIVQFAVFGSDNGLGEARETHRMVQSYLRDAERLAAERR